MALNKAAVKKLKFVKARKMVNKKPRLSIGLPVFNGEKYLRHAIDSILSQTYTDFELILSDNASTDKTEEICREYAQMDTRIRYYRNKSNLGGPANYNLAFKLSLGEYFKWAAYDDLLTSEYLEKCVDVLDDDPSVVLCHSRVGCIDENGVLIGNYDNRTLHRIDSFKPHERFADLISLRNTCWAIHAVMRSSSLSKTPLHGDYIDADRNLLAELGLRGRFYEIPEHLFLRRDHPQAYTSIYYSERKVCDYRTQLFWWTGRKKKMLLVLPHWKNCLEYFVSINRVPLNLSERLLCYREIYRWLIRENGLQLMKWDLVNELNLWRIKLHYGQSKKGAA
jgi:glycosyltransferase involved in cell wall biosynthesis